MTELIIIILIVAAVLFSIGRSLWRAWNGSQPGGCGGSCSSCPLRKNCGTLNSDVSLSKENSANTDAKANKEKLQ